jgi:hypothetical protein
MAIFNFQCKDNFDIHKEELYIFEDIIFSTENIDSIKCPICKSDTIKIFSPPKHIQFNGKGWTEKSKNRNYDSTQGIRDQIDELKKEKSNMTTEQLFNPNGDKNI